MSAEISEERSSRFARALKTRILLGDGANGTWLSIQGYDQQPYDTANINAPDLVQDTHRAYAEAGSDFVETNTFSANRIRLSGLNFDPVEINREGARLARAGVGEDKFVLGAIGPCGKPLEPIGTITAEEAFEAFREQAQALAEGGVDGFMLETFIDLDELAIAVSAVREVSALPIIVSKAFIEDGEALLEGLPGKSAALMSLPGVLAVGANCVVGPQRMIDIVRQLAEASDLPIIAMPTPGLPQIVKGKVVYDVAPDYFARSAARLVEEGARIIGGCCGTTPDHIRGMREILDSGSVKVKQTKQHQKAASDRAPLAESDPTELSMKLKNGKFITSIEMDLPRGLNVDRVIDGAKRLKVAGADIVDISDGARARLRMNPLSVCKLIQDKVGIEAMMHFACRDRNLLAVQADLLGAHALGIRNILAITGDPANIGDYPSATSVFDVDAIGLVRILNRFNEGIDLAGYSVGVKCAFTIAIAFNPMAQDLSSELDRLSRKADAGAHVIYTQPLYAQEHVDQALEVGRRFDLPVFIGILPLKHSRHAEFMHNEVPGIEIPGWLLKELSGASSDDDGMEIGIAYAQKLGEYVRSTAQGLYLMPPFGSTVIAERILNAVL